MKSLNQRFVLPSAVHGARQEEVIDHRLTDREWAEEWKHLDNVRIGVVDMS